MQSLWFDDSEEPDDYKFQFLEEMKEILKEEGVSAVTINFDNKEDYYNILNRSREFIENGIKVSYTSKGDVYDVILEEDEDL